MKHKIRDEEEGVPFWVYATLGASLLGGVGFCIWLVWVLYTSVGAIP